MIVANNSVCDEPSPMVTMIVPVGMPSIRKTLKYIRLVPLMKMTSTQSTANWRKHKLSGGPIPLGCHIFAWATTANLVVSHRSVSLKYDLTWYDMIILGMKFCDVLWFYTSLNIWHVIVTGNLSWLTQCDDEYASIKYFEHSFASKSCDREHNAVSIWNKWQQYFQEQVTVHQKQNENVPNTVRAGCNKTTSCA